MVNSKNWNILIDYIENSYKFNPDILMPLLVATLATKGQLKITESADPIKNQIMSFEPASFIEFDWVKCNAALKKRIADWTAKGVRYVGLGTTMKGFVKETFDFFYRYDNETVVREYHYRIGRLMHHSMNERSEQAYRQYVFFKMGEAFISTPKKFLKDNFVEIYNHILVLSGIQPPRPRLDVGKAMRRMLDYDGVSTVYNPFAGCGIAAAMLGAGANLYADGDADDKLFYVLQLLVFGSEGNVENIKQRNSANWTGLNPKYVLSTFLGNIDARPAFDFCLAKCLKSLPKGGRFVGAVKPACIFDNISAEMAAVMKKDWLDTILLLPFGEAVVLVNTQKEDRAKGKVKLFNMASPLLRNESPDVVLSSESFCQMLDLSDVKKKGYLKSVVAPDLPDRYGYATVRLGDILSPMRKTMYDLEKYEYDKRILARPSRNDSYHGLAFVDSFDKERVSVLFEPAYHLTKDALVFNSAGMLEPRAYDASSGAAFLTEGYAFTVKDNPYFDIFDLINELTQQYVTDQIFPYGVDKMLPQHIDSKAILDVKLFKVLPQSSSISESDLPMSSASDSTSFSSSPDEYDPEMEYNQCDEDARLKLVGLGNGYVQYRNIKLLGRGGFGMTYRADKVDTLTGDKSIVVLKEFFPMRRAKRVKGSRVEFAEWFPAIKAKGDFKREAQKMKLFGENPDNHIMKVNDIFNIESTNTLYYEMKYYKDGSFWDMIRSNRIPNEEAVVSRIVVPMCKAMHTIHAEPYQFLHADIKPDNILIDEDGYATLIDFGMAKRFIDNYSGFGGTTYYMAPEQRKDDLEHIGPWTDIYSMAATFYVAFSHGSPLFAADNEDDYNRLYEKLDCTEQTKQAILAGMKANYKDRPQNAQAFVNLFPGCETIKL